MPTIASYFGDLESFFQDWASLCGPGSLNSRASSPGAKIKGVHHHSLKRKKKILGSEGGRLRNSSSLRFKATLGLISNTRETVEGGGFPDSSQLQVEGCESGEQSK